MKFTINLWRTFAFIVSVSLLSVVAAGYFNWKEVLEESKLELKYTNHFVSRSMDLILKKNESFLSILGQRLIEIDSNGKRDQQKKLINQFFKQHPELLGFGLADLKGELKINLGSDEQRSRNYLQQTPGNANLFDLALTTDKMVIGRTYFLPSVKSWVIPLNYRLSDDNGQLVGVISTAFLLDSPHSFWSNANKNFSDIDIVFVRKDLYRQSVSNAGKPGKIDYQELYNKPIDDKHFSDFDRRLDQQAGKRFRDLENVGGIYAIEFVNVFKQKVLIAIQYDRKRSYYIATSIPYKLLYNKIYQSSIWLFALWLIFNSTLFFFFRLNENIQKEAKENLKFQANHDRLTGLPNRRYLDQIYTQIVKDYNSEFSLLFIDLDNFKNCNDIHGHSVGDRVLKEVAKRINLTFRSCLNIRQGGDEFIIVSRLTKEKELTMMCDEFYRLLSKPLFIGTIEFSIRASVGISRSPFDGIELEDLMRKADMAMYDAKKKSRVSVIYSNELELRTERTALIEKELSLALKRNELTIAYQPQVNAKHHQIVGMEALLRWNNPTLGMIPPDEFIPIAEVNGLINEIGEYVLNQAIVDCIKVYQSLPDDSYIKESPRHFRISINVSVVQLVNEKFISILSRILRRHDINNIEIMLEVTESLFIEDVEKAKSVLGEINALGVGVSLDDFGTGYSSLNVLNKLPIDELKIDRSFVKDILEDQQDRRLIHSIIILSKSLGIPVLAEGVEEAQQASLLTKYGCDLFQGYFFSRPISIEDVIKFITPKVS
jgi:diguanylate cyclase (GGDEF)-like protein